MLRCLLCFKSGVPAFRRTARRLISRSRRPLNQLPGIYPAMQRVHPHRRHRKRRDPVLKTFWLILKSLLAVQPLLQDLEATHPEFRQSGQSGHVRTQIPPLPDTPDVSLGELVTRVYILAQEQILNLLQTLDYSQAFPILPTCQAQTC